MALTHMDIFLFVLFRGLFPVILFIYIVYSGDYDNQLSRGVQ